MRGHLQKHQDSGEPAFCADGCSTAHAWLAAVQRAALLGWQQDRCIAQPSPAMGFKMLCIVTALNICEVTLQGLQYNTSAMQSTAFGGSVHAQALP